ncbi:tripartite tricarboxylate transporter substrate binding protein [Rhodovarius crocodyli]|uniref:Tripartite tricarboxylate transporter substrate binding protein n=1 Tax=Rhodovarius crocodyli TaxID=1979269 RepID=A0A437ME59_9PROT|nr:tripartite tricarboxylate transporter substrate binding protein [Rhodovarius crocodyli]RVT95895.1 tripartite tricarboxylate transporter substrate binding protein [Rhodovarius crocodyli]
MQRRSVIAAATALPFSAPGLVSAQGFTPQNPECIAPAAPGGGFDITCRLTTRVLQETGISPVPIRTQNMPGGIGAVAINNINAQRRSDPNVIVAFSTGSWLNMAQGRFGRFGENDVRWIGAIGADYGVICVKRDSPFNNLQDLMNGFRQNVAGIPVGSSGAVGSQDWTKVALVARAAGQDPRRMRYVPFEGGGAAMAALLGGHIQVFPGDASEIRGQYEAREIKILAVLSPNRLPGVLADVPTAKEQGVNIEWPIVRGFYGPPQMPDAAYTWWVDAIRRLQAHPNWAEQRNAQGLFEFNMVGEEFSAFAKARTAEYRQLARDVGIVPAQ